MKLTSALHVCAIAVSSVLLAAHSYAEPKLIASVDFEDGQIPRGGCWWFDDQNGGEVTVSTTPELNQGGSKGSIRGRYPVPRGDLYVWGGCDISTLNTKEIYIEFDAKMPSAAKHGLKFVKVFGQRDGTAYANTTFGLDYTGVDYGSMYSVGYGDGATNSNDVQSIISFDGSNDFGKPAYSWIGRSAAYTSTKTYLNELIPGIYDGRKSAEIVTPQDKLWASANWGTSWHHFKFHVKFNDGTTLANEVPNGSISVEIDGKKYLDAKGIFNRHFTNKPIEKVTFFDWSQSGTKEFEIWYDNIRLSTGGFMPSTTTTSPAPNAPTSPTIK